MVNNVDRVDPREIQSLQRYLNEYRQQAEIFTQQLSLLEEGRMEAIAAIEALEGAAALNIGAEVIVERSNTAAQDYLKDRITEMEASAKKVAETLDRLHGQMNDIARRIEMGYQQAQMAQMHPAPGPKPGDE